MGYRVADYLSEFISDTLKCKHVFLLTGAGIMHITDAVARNDKLTPVPVHHEQTSSMAADAYSKITGGVSVSIYSTGPAATNALTGLAGAWQDSVPSLFVSGQVKTSETTFGKGFGSEVRQFGVQELDIMPAVNSFSKYAVQVSDPTQIRFELEKAVHIAKSGRPGPVWVEIPMDVQSALIDKKSLVSYLSEDTEGAPASETRQQIEVLADDLEKALRPVILVGQGVQLSKSTGVLKDLVESLNIPVVTTYLGIDSVSNISTQFIGPVGVKGSRAGNLAMQNADLLIVIGSSLHVSVIGYNYEEFAPGAKKYVVDIDARVHSKPTINDINVIESDAKKMLSVLAEVCRIKQVQSFASWLTHCISWRGMYPVCLPEYSTGTKINIYKVVDAASRLAGPNDIFISDAGSAYYAVSQALSLKGRNQRYVTSGAMATMGYTIPAAIGASLASGKESSVLAFTGDGSFQFNLQELQTIKSLALPIKILILNNDGYLSIRASQDNYFGGLRIGSGPDTGVSVPDAIAIAGAYGIPSARVENLEKLDEMLELALESEGPFLLDILTDPDQLIVPTVSSRLREDGSLESRPLEDMYPFLPRDEYLGNLFGKAK